MKTTPLRILCLAAAWTICAPAFAQTPIIISKAKVNGALPGGPTAGATLDAGVTIQQDYNFAWMADFDVAQWGDAGCSTPGVNWTLTGALPPGLSLTRSVYSPATIPGAPAEFATGYGSESLICLTGVPTTPGTYSFTLQNQAVTRLGQPVQCPPSAVVACTITIVATRPPTITRQPVGKTATSGERVTLSVAAQWADAQQGLYLTTISYQWRKNGVPIASDPVAALTSSTLTLDNVRAADAGVYSVVVSNRLASVVSASAVLTVNPAPAAPAISTTPASQTVVAGRSVTLGGSASGVPAPSYQWRKNGVDLPGATAATLTFPAVQAADAGSYTLVATNASGTARSADAVLTVISPPALTSSPLSQAVKAGASVTLGGAASANGGALSYQWLKNGGPIAGANQAALALTDLLPAAAGAYALVVTNEAGSITSAPAELTVLFSWLGNLSVLAPVRPGDGLIAGFAVAGAASKPFLLRAAGPSLAQFGVANVLAAPRLTLFNARSQALATNAGWGGGGALASAFTRTGAFAWPANSADAAALAVLGAGAATVQVSATGNASGLTLAEIYDADPAPTDLTRLVNVSARVPVAAGEMLTVGFVIAGNTPKKILVRAVGPTLAAFGVADALPAVQLALFDANRRTLATNAGWGGDAALANAFAQTGAFALPAASVDAALLATLAPGAYTAQVTGLGGAAGSVLVEVYEVP